MSANKQAVARLNKELKNFLKDPPPHILIGLEDKDMLTWYYLLMPPPGNPYHGGAYWGKLKFPKDYPFKPPQIQMITPNGRFKTNTPLCLSMSDFHPETWNPMWCVGTILTGVLSFMLEETPTQGSVEEPVSNAEKQRLAQASMAHNLKEAKFRSQFPDAEEAYKAEMEKYKPAAAAAAAAAVPEGGGKEGTFAAGCQVRIDGIKSRPEINGQVGTVVEFLAERERYNVRLGDGEELALKAAALSLQ